MKPVLYGALQLALFIICGAAYADIATKFVPLYSLDTAVREVVFYSFAIISSAISVALIKNVFGLYAK